MSSLRLRTARGIPRAPPVPAAVDTNAAAIVVHNNNINTGDMKMGINSVTPSHSSNSRNAALFPQVLAHRRRRGPIFHPKSSPGDAHQTRIINDLWRNEKSEYGRHRMASCTARQSGEGEGLPSTADDDDLDSFVHNGQGDAAAAQLLSSEGEGEVYEQMGGLLVEQRRANTLEIEERPAVPQKRGCGPSSSQGSEVGTAYGTESPARSSSCDEEEVDDQQAHVTESLRSDVRHGRELSRLSNVVESPVRNFLAVLCQHDVESRQGVKSNGSVGKIGGENSIDDRLSRKAEKCSSTSRDGMNRGGGSPTTRAAEVREVTRKGELRSGPKGELAVRKFKLHEHSNAENASEDEDKRFMIEALVEARKAAMAGEVPVGCVMVQNRKIIARAYNSVESKGDPTAHAEMLCIQMACKNQGNWRLTDATLYVTLEPCPMCAGAILQSRVGKLVWGSKNTLLGADGSWVSLLPEGEERMVEDRVQTENIPRRVHPFHRSLTVHREVLADDCAVIMKSFFQERRKNRRPLVKSKPSWLPLTIWVLFKRIQCQWSLLRGL